MAYQISINGNLDNQAQQVALIMYYNGIVYYENTSGVWFQENGVTGPWIQLSNDPRLAQQNLIMLPSGATIFMPDGSTLVYPGGTGGGPLPAQVTGVTATTSANLINVSWTPAFAQNTTYTTYLSQVLNGTYTAASYSVASPPASIIVAPGTWYAEVQAVNVNGAGPISAQAGPFTVPGSATLPPKVTGVSATVAPLQLTVNWSAVTGTGITYTVLTSNAVGGPFTAVKTQLTTLTTTFAVTAGTWYVEVQAVNSVGGGPLSDVAGPYTVTSTAATKIIPNTDGITHTSGGVPIVNARKLRNGWGVNAPNPGTGNSPTAAQVTNALNFIQTRWVRMQFDGDNSPAVQALQNGLVTAGVFDPNLCVNMLLNDYQQNAAVNTFAAQSGWLLNNVLPIKGPNGFSVLKAIEGPNEMNSHDGIGPRGPSGTTDLSGNFQTGADNPTADANFIDWATQLSTFRNKNAAAFSGVEILSPTILYYFASNWSTSLNSTGLVDYGTIHYYAGLTGTNGCPSFPANPDNFSQYYGFAKAGIGPNLSLVQSEGGTSTQNGGYSSTDGRSSCRYMIMQLLDHFAMGGHRFLIYNLMNNHVNDPTLSNGQLNVPGNPGTYNEDNFGIYWGDFTTAKPHATALHNFANLMSLGNSYSNAANLSDSAAVPLNYTSNPTVSGLTNAGGAGSLMIMPKSDGTTMLAVWNEPTIDSGNGTSASIAANNVVVNLGGSHSYKVYDCMGGGNVNTFTVSTNAITSPILTGTGSTINLTLFGNPLFIELLN